MSDDVGISVAAISVVASALITFSTLWFNFRQGKEQRKHDAEQAFHDRAWEYQRDGHIKLLEVLATIKNMAGSPYVVATHSSGTWSQQLRDAQGVVMAYGSDACQDDIESLLSLLASLHPREEVASLVVDAMEADEAINEFILEPGAGGLLAPKVARFQQARKAAIAAYEYDEEGLKAAVQKAIASTRASLRGSPNA